MLTRAIFFFFLRRAIYTQMQRVIATNGSRGKRRKGHRPPNRRLSEHTGVDALESNTQSQVQRESDHKKKKKPVWWESQSSGFTVLDESHTLGLFRDLSLSRAAQGCRAGCRTVGQYNTSEAHWGTGKGCEVTLLGNKTSLTSAPHLTMRHHWLSPQTNFSSPESTIFFNTSREIVLGIKYSARHQWSLGTRQTEVCIAMGNRRISHS